MEKTPDNFEVMAIFPVRNEADIIEATVGKLLDNGVRVHIMDNWSSDGTWELLQAIENDNLYVERYPKDGEDEYFQMTDILKRIEEIALQHPGAWILGQGSDEILRPPWPDMSLKDALYKVEKEGYNFITVLLHQFEPVDDDFRRGMDPEEHFEYFWMEKKHLHRRIWKQPEERVNVAGSASHDVNFNGRKIYPETFIMKHYRVRTQEQGEKKIEERKQRYDPEEIKKGYHTHYNHINKGYNFIKDPAKLLLFKEQYPELIGGEKRMKEYLDAEKSDRADKLLIVVDDYIAGNKSVLDIGVGCGTLDLHEDVGYRELSYTGIDNDIDIKKLKKRSPDCKWMKKEVEDFVPKKFDLVIHTAMASLQVGGRFWRIHKLLLSQPETMPDTVILEAGKYRKGGSNPLKTFETVKKMYMDKGYHIEKSGDFHVEKKDFPIPHRFYAVLTRILIKQKAIEEVVDEVVDKIVDEVVDEVVDEFIDGIMGDDAPEEKSWK